MKPPLHKVYLIAFGDGASYVGRTQMEVSERVASHRRSDINKELRDRLLAGAFRVEVVWSGTDDRLCGDIERSAALAQPKPLNRILVPETANKGAVTPSKRRYSSKPPKPRREGIVVSCSWCREIKPSLLFHSDSRRSSGLSSRCKDCSRLYQFMLNKHRDDKAMKQKAYSLAKRWCQRGRRDRLARLVDHNPPPVFCDRRQRELAEQIMARHADIARKVREFV